MRILRMTMSHSQIPKKNNFQPDVQITTVYKNSSFQPERYFLDRGFFILIIIFFNHLFRIPYFSISLCTCQKYKNKKCGNATKSIIKKCRNMINKELKNAER